MTLRARLLLGMGMVAAVLVLAGVFVVTDARRRLLDQVDARLRSAAVFRPDGPGGRGGPPTPEDAASSSLYVAVVSGGQLRTVSVPLTVRATAEQPVPLVTAERAVAAAADETPFTVPSDGEAEYRLLARRPPRFPGVVVVGLPLDEVEESMAGITTLVVIGVAGALAAVGVVTWWVLRLGVRPVKRIAAAASAMGAGDLSARVPEGEPGTEAGDLAVALNRMLGRIEDAFAERERADQRLRQFVADASHELRTPVTTIRGYAELYRTGGLPPGGALDEAMRRTEQEAVRMGSLVEDLLLLARLDQGRPLERAPVDLAAVVHDAGRDARAVDPTRPVSVEADGPLVVQGDDGRLRQVVGNLVGNALVHTPPGTAVRLSARRDGDRAVVEVADDGPGMAPEVAARAFERFFRGDPSRSRHRGGSGLGLAIVHSTVAAHGGTVDLVTAPGQGTTVRLVLPAGDGGARR